MTAPGCPSREQLSAYLLGTLEEGEVPSVAEHLEQCANCESTVEALENESDTFVSHLRKKTPADPFLAEPQCVAALDLAVQVAGSPDPCDSGNPTDKARPSGADLGQLRDYRLLARLGQGGMGTVYKAVHSRLDKLVAIKVLAPERTRDARALARFEREMKAVGQLDHPNIVRAFDAGEASGTYFLAMELVEGLDLSTVARRLGTLPIADACEVIRQAAAALEYAHEHGMVHRDIKPSNLMLTPGGQVKILDLGLALLEHDQADELTGSSQVMGTAEYLAPEQADASHAVDIRADVYSLGCTLYRFLTGQVPYGGPRFDTALKKMMAHTREPIPDVRQRRPEVPDSLVAVLERMLAKTPAERFSTPADVAAALMDLAAGSNLVELSQAAERAKPEAKSEESSLDPRGQVPLATHEADSVAVPSHTTVSAQHSPREPLDRCRPLPARSIPPGRRRVMTSLAAVGGLMLLAGIVVLIRNKDGKLVGKMEVPEGGSAVIEHEGPVGPHATPTPAVSVAKPGAKRRTAGLLAYLEPEALDLPAGAPISRSALVTKPAPLPGALSWTIETIGHRGLYTCVAYRPDGKMLATCCIEETIRLWNPDNGKLLRAIEAHDRTVEGIAWSPDGTVLASASRDGTVRLWDPESGRRLLTLRGESGYQSIAWSPTAPLLVAGRKNGGIQYWEFSATGAWDEHREGWSPVVRGVRTRTVQEEAIRSLDFTKDGKLLVVIRESSAVCLLDVESGALRLVLPCSVSGKGVAFAPDGQSVVLPTSGAGQAIGSNPAFWDIKTGWLVRELSFLRELLPGSFTPTCVALSPDGKIVASGDHYRPSPGALVCDLETEKPLYQAPQTDTVHTLQFSPNGKMLAAGAEIGPAYTWEAGSGRLLATLPAHPGEIFSLAWHPDGKTVAWAQGTFIHPFKVRVAALSSGAVVKEMGVLDELFAMAWSGDGKRLASGGNRLWVHAMPSGAEKWRKGFEKDPMKSRAFCLAWSPNGAALACGGDPDPGTEPHELNAATGELLHTLPGAGKVLAYSPDGKLLAIEAGSEVKITGTERGETRETLACPAQVTALAWSSNGEILAAACEDKKVHLFEVASNRIVATCVGHTGRVNSVRWLAGENKLLSASNAEACLWDAASGKALRTVAIDGDALVQNPDWDRTTLSPDGKLVAAMGRAMVRLWNTTDGKPVRTLLSLRDGQYAAVTPDGHFSGSPDVQSEFVYVVQTKDGQETLSPSEFAKRYGWKN